MSFYYPTARERTAQSIACGQRQSRIEARERARRDGRLRRARIRRVAIPTLCVVLYVVGVAAIDWRVALPAAVVLAAVLMGLVAWGEA